MATRSTRSLRSVALAAAVLAPVLLAGGAPAGARPRTPPTTCATPAPCAAPWMAHVTNLVLGRAPEDGDYGTLSPSADLTPAQRTAAVTRLLTSLEGREFTVQLHYYLLLDRSPDPSGADFWPRAMVDGRRNTELLAGSLMGSTEYARKWPDWISEMYRDILRREPDPSGHAYWTDQATRQSHERVARRFLSTAAARRERTRVVYASLLAGIRDSGPTSAEITRGAGLLGHFTGEDELIIEILSSDEVYDGVQAD